MRIIGSASYRLTPYANAPRGGGSAQLAGMRTRQQDRAFQPAADRWREVDGFAIITLKDVYSCQPARLPSSVIKLIGGKMAFTQNRLLLK